MSSLFFNSAVKVPSTLFASSGDLYLNPEFRTMGFYVRLEQALAAYKQNLVKHDNAEKTSKPARKVLNDALAETKSFLSSSQAQQSTGMVKLVTLVEQVKQQLKNAPLPKSELDLSVIKIVDDKRNLDGSLTSTIKTNRRILGELSATLPRPTSNDVLDTYNKINYGATKALNGFVGDLTIGFAGLPQAGIDAARSAKTYAAIIAETAAQDAGKAAKKLLKDAVTAYGQHLPIIVAGTIADQWRKDRITEFNTTRQTAGLLAASTETLVHGALDIAFLGKMAKKGAPISKLKGTLPKNFQPFVEHINGLNAKTYAMLTKEQLRISIDVLKANRAQPGVKQALNTLNRLSKTKNAQGKNARTVAENRRPTPVTKQVFPPSVTPNSNSPSNTIIPTLSNVDMTKTHINNSVPPKLKAKSNPALKKSSPDNSQSKKDNSESLRQQQQDAAWGKQTGGNRTYNKPEEFDPFNSKPSNKQQPDSMSITPKEARKTKLRSQMEKVKLDEVDRRFDGIKFSVNTGYFCDNLWQETFIFASSLKSEVELNRLIELLESTPKTKDYFKLFIPQLHTMINNIARMETDFYNNSGLSYVEDFKPINTPKSFQVKTEQVYEDLAANKLPIEILRAEKKPSIFSKIVNGAKSISQNIEKSLNNATKSKIKKERKDTLKTEEHLDITEVLSPVISYHELTSMFWVKDRGADHESQIYPFHNLTQSDFIRLNIMYFDKAKEIQNAISKRREVVSKRASVNDYSPRDVKMIYFQGITLEALSPRYDQKVLKHVIEMQKQGKSPLNSEDFNPHEASLLRKAIVPDFFELGYYRHNIIQFFVDTNLSFEEVDKFKDLTNKIYAFASMHTKSNKYDDFLKLLNRYTISKISHKITNKEPVKGIFNHLLVVNPRLTDLNRTEFKLVDPILDAYLEKLTQLMKHELNEW